MATGIFRRRFLAATVAGCTTLSDSSRYNTAKAQTQAVQEAIPPSQTIRLDGEVSGWHGRAPAAIEGETNPTLSLEAGQTYRLTWKNTDGQRHNVALLDADGARLKRTSFIAEPGTVQTFTFTATRKMAEYVCEAHLGSMRGDIIIEGQQTPSSNGDQSDDRFMPWGPTVGIEAVADGPLSAPLDFRVVPDGTDRHCIVDQVGQIYILNSDGRQIEPFLDIADRLVDFGDIEDNRIDERGLLGLAFHPLFDINHKFYVRYSAPARPKTPKSYTHVERLSEFTAGQNGQQGRPNSERILLDIPSPHYTHNAGSIVFGPEHGYLYMGMGDGGGSKREAGHAEDWYRNNGGNGQNVEDNLLGSILRLDVDGRESGKAYAIPDDNPLVGKNGLNEHYAWGFRNPWRMSFNQGRLFVADVGESNYEEVNIVEKGMNYGWNVREGRHCYSTDNPGNPPEECPQRTPPSVRGGEQFVDPIIEYPHAYEGEGIGLAVIGGYLYENDSVPKLQGKYVFGDYSKNGDPRGSLFAATPPTGAGEKDDTTVWSLEELKLADSQTNELGSYVLGFGRDNVGDLYVLTTENLGVDPATETGQVRKLISKTESNGPTANRDDAMSTTDGPGFGVLATIGGGLAAGLLRVLTKHKRG